VRRSDQPNVLYADVPVRLSTTSRERSYRPAILTSPKLLLGSYEWDFGNGATK
jgi:hypothetical protein